MEAIMERTKAKKWRERSLGGCREVRLEEDRHRKDF
jgi:hypothetical protein